MRSVFKIKAGGEAEAFEANLGRSRGSRAASATAARMYLGDFMFLVLVIFLVEDPDTQKNKEPPKTRTLPTKWETKSRFLANSHAPFLRPGVLPATQSERQVVVADCRQRPDSRFRFPEKSEKASSWLDTSPRELSALGTDLLPVTVARLSPVFTAFPALQPYQ